MLSTERTPRFRNISVTRLSRYDSSVISSNEKDTDEHRDPEKECFMCRQANVYVKPIGMQQERRVARRRPPVLTRGQMEALGQKKNLTRKEARKLLQCYFPEIKNVKYFQLHKYHSCCYDTKHLNLCKNHITALQHEREQCSNHEHYNLYARADESQNRVSFVRIKIEPTKGIPTRFLAPAALPESLADMLIKQVNRLEKKRKLPSLESPPMNIFQTEAIPRSEQISNHGINSVSEYLTTLDSDDDDSDDDDDDDDGDNNNGDNYTHDNNERLDTENSGIRGYYGNVMGRSRTKYEEKVQTKQERQREKSIKIVNNNDLIVEDVEDLKNLFVHEEEPIKIEKLVEPLKKKKRKKRTKKHTQTHHVTKLNHWEMMALEQSKKEVCGCRHHVERLEAHQVMYDWCRCKDHQHKEVKEKHKPLSTPPEKQKQITPPSKAPKVQTKTVGINATELTTTELALAYDPSTVDYDVIKEAIYYRTSSGRMVKPEITNSFVYDNIVSSADYSHHKTLTDKTDVVFMTVKGEFQPIQDDRDRRKRNSLSPTLSNAGNLPRSQAVIDTEISSVTSKTNKVIPIHKKTILTTKKSGAMYEDDDNDDDDDDDYNNGDNASIKIISSKPIQETPINSPIESPTIPMSQQKSSKPTYVNNKATPNYENQSSIVDNRRWFDQALGDQNLLPVHDGRYGLIAGTSTDDYALKSRLPDNDYTENYAPRNRSNCTIS